MRVEPKRLRALERQQDVVTKPRVRNSFAANLREARVDLRRHLDACFLGFGMFFGLRLFLRLVFLISGRILLILIVTRRLILVGSLGLIAGMIVLVEQRGYAIAFLF